MGSARWLCCTGSGPRVWCKASKLAWCMAVWGWVACVIPWEVATAGGAPTGCGHIAWGVVLGCGIRCAGSVVHDCRAWPREWLWHGGTGNTHQLWPHGVGISPGV